MNVLILGGTGVISRAIVNLLLEKEHTVTIFNRGNRALSFSGSVRQITGDRADRADFESRMRQESFSGLFDNSKIRGVVPDFRCDISLHDGIKMMVDWFEQQANQVDAEKDAMEDRLVELHAGWKSQMQELSAGT